MDRGIGWGGFRPCFWGAEVPAGGVGKAGGVEAKRVASPRRTLASPPAPCPADVGAQRVP